jgi:hypothetical protein
MGPIEALIVQVQRAADQGYLDKSYQELHLLALLMIAERIEAATLLLRGRNPSLDQALNSGDGTYRP